MLELLLSSLLTYQYWLLFSVALVASIGFPVPATAIIIAGGAFSAQGYFDEQYIFLSGVIGCIMGDSIAYSLSYRYGEGLLRSIRLGKILDSRAFATLRPIFVRHDIISVFVTRWILTGLGSSVNILAGITKMPPSIYILTDIIGEVLYMIVCISIGYTFGSEWESILTLLDSFSTMLVSLTLIGIISIVLYRHRSPKSQK